MRQVVHKFGPEQRHITLAELKTLDPNIPSTEIQLLTNDNRLFQVGWLTDSIIDYYLFQLCGNRSSKVLYLPPSTGDLLSTEMLDGGILDRFLPFASQRYHKIIIPCNPTRNHWILLVVLKFTGTFYILDPANNNPLSIHSIQHYVDNLVQILFVITNRRYEHVLPRRVMQTDSHSCGIYVCYYAYRLLYGGKLTEPFDEMDLRQKIYHSILDH